MEQNNTNYLSVETEEDMLLELEKLEKKKIKEGFKNNSNYIDEKETFAQVYNQNVHRPWKKLKPRKCEEITYHYDDGPMETLYFPFGSAGGGAPNIPQPKTTEFLSDITMENDFEEIKKRELAASKYVEELEHVILEKQLNKLRDKQENGSPTTSFVELLKMSKVGKPRRDPQTGILTNQHLSSSDATNLHQWQSRRHEHDMFTSQLGNVKAKSKESLRTNEFPKEECENNLNVNLYGNELLREAKFKTRFKQLDRLREVHEAAAHALVFDGLWGRPGGGAPNGFTARRRTLQDLKAYTNTPAGDGTFQPNNETQIIAPNGAYWERRAYVQPSGVFISQQLPVKFCHGSDHCNRYDLPSNTITKLIYKTQAPYAIDEKD